MYRIQTLNEISGVINQVFNSDYEIGKDVSQPDAIIVRSAKMHDMELPDTLTAVARAGAGYNNIPVDKCSQQGIVVFNTPGANANAVKELVIAGMLLAGRDIIGGAEWARTLKGQGDKVGALVEKGKGQFVGPELKGKKLAVIGLGAIGTMVANTGRALDMDVYGNDPFLSVEHALQLSRAVHVVNLDQLLACADIVSLHVPLMDATRGMVNADYLARMKDGAVLLNFSRGELVDSDAVLAALKSGKLRRYVTDIPTDDMLCTEGVIALPHLGASTPESEDNCAEMAARQIVDYLTRGAIVNSVNYPACDPGTTAGPRLCVLHANVPNMVGAVTGLLAGKGINISNMVNKSRGNVAYTVIDVDTAIDAATVDAIAAVDNVYKVRLIG